MIDRELLKYYLILRELDRPVGVREAQRILGFNSPGKSQRVLHKLVRLGLASKRGDGKYEIVRDPPLELVGKVFIRGRLLPKVLIITSYITTLSFSYVVLASPGLEVIILLLLINMPLWIESVVEYVELRKRWF